MLFSIRENDIPGMAVSPIAASPLCSMCASTSQLWWSFVDSRDGRREILVECRAHLQVPATQLLGQYPTPVKIEDFKILAKRPSEKNLVSKSLPFRVCFSL